MELKTTNCYCLDCRWCEISINFEGGPNYVCQKTGKRLKDSLLWRRPCKDFVHGSRGAGQGVGP